MIKHKILDKKRAVKKAAGDPQLAKELFAILLKELPDQLEKLNSAYAKGALGSLWDHAHQIHGSTAYCGVPILQQAVSSLESALKLKDNDKIRTQLTNTNQAIKQLLNQGPLWLEQEWS